MNSLLKYTIGQINLSCEILLPILATHDGKESDSLWMLNYMRLFKFKLKQKYNASMALVTLQALNRHVTSGSHTGQHSSRHLHHYRKFLWAVLV